MFNGNVVDSGLSAIGSQSSVGRSMSMQVPGTSYDKTVRWSG